MVENTDLAVLRDRIHKPGIPWRVEPHTLSTAEAHHQIPVQLEVCHATQAEPRIQALRNPPISRCELAA